MEDSGAGWGSGNENSVFNEVKRNINLGNIRAAEEILDRIDIRNAQWYYLKGIVFLRKGWYDEAVSHIRRLSAWTLTTRSTGVRLARFK